MVVDRAVANELDLGYSRDGFQVRMKNRFFLGASLVISMTIALASRIEFLLYDVVNVIA